MKLWTQLLQWILFSYVYSGHCQWSLDCSGHRILVLWEYSKVSYAEDWKPFDVDASFFLVKL